MRKTLKNKTIEVCNSKIESKGQNVGPSFYAFFANKNDDPELLMEEKRDHFEKEIKIKGMIETMD